MGTDHNLASTMPRDISIKVAPMGFEEAIWLLSLPFPWIRGSGPSERYRTMIKPQTPSWRSWSVLQNGWSKYCCAKADRRTKG